MNQTGIQWTDRTWNPVTGCSKVSHWLGVRLLEDGCEDDLGKMLWRVGTKAAGAILDGREWREFPAAAGVAG